MIKRSLVIKYDTIQHLKGEVHSKESLPLISLSFSSISLSFSLFLSLCFSVSVSLSSDQYISTMHILYLMNPLKISIDISNTKNVDADYAYSDENFVLTQPFKTKHFGHTFIKYTNICTGTCSHWLKWKQWVNKFNAPSEADVKIDSYSMLTNRSMLVKF